MMVFCHPIPGNPPTSKFVYPLQRSGRAVTCDEDRGEVFSAAYGAHHAEGFTPSGTLFLCGGVVYAHMSHASGDDLENAVDAERGRLGMDRIQDFSLPQHAVGEAWKTDSCFLRITPYEFLPPSKPEPLTLAGFGDLSKLPSTSKMLLALRTLLEASVGMERQADLSTLLDMVEQLLQESEQAKP